MSCLAFRDERSTRSPAAILFTIAAAAAVIPSVVAVTSEGVEQRRIWGLPVTRIPWPEVESALEIAGTGEIQIQSRSGMIIARSDHHVDGERLETELEKRGISIGRHGDYDMAGVAFESDSTRLVNGQHLGFDTNRNYPMPNLFVSMLQRMGIESDKFASSTGSMRGLEVKG